VVKVGGSLFDEPNLAGRLEGWLARQSRGSPVLIAGGGPWAEAIRAADARFVLPEDAAHQMCIGAMGISAQLLRQLLPRAEWAAKLASIADHVGSPLILDVEDFLRREEPQVDGPPLPHTWQVTSDSIAARVAVAMGAAELVLLKSALPPSGTSMFQAAANGYVDQFFPIAAAGLARIRCVNLRDEIAPEVEWSARGGIG
jgi:aspartokinase-like uncharacterized kinase